MSAHSGRWCLGAMLSMGIALPALADATDWQICGRGKAEAWGWLDVAKIELRRSDCTEPWRLDGDSAPWQLTFNYVRSVPAKAFRKSATVILERQLQLSKGEQQLLAEFHQHYADVEDNDQYRLTYLPGRGLSLELNGGEVGRLNDERLGYAYAAIWLGEAPFDQSLRQQLLFGK